MRFFIRSGGVLLVLAVALSVAASASASARPVVGHVYINDNTAGTNTIAAFDRHADGSLTPVPGSPFTAGGAGTGTGLSSQGAIQVTGDGRYVLAVDAGSNQISVLRISHDGALKLVRDGVVASRGSEPVSLAEHHGLVYVANSGADDSNYTGFTLTQGGRLRPLRGSTRTLPDGAQPGDVLFNSTGTILVGTRVGSSQIDSFTVGSDGLLTRSPGSPRAAQGPGPFGSEFRPTNPRQLFVSNAHGAPGAGTVSAFRAARDGRLSSIGDSPFADDQTAPCWVEITHDGRFLFTVNTGSGSVSRYSIARDGALTLLGSTAIDGGPGIGAVDARLSTDGKDLYVDESKVPAVAEFTVIGGNLSQIGTVPLPTGAAPAGVAVN